jgi:hypothetical protein
VVEVRLDRVVVVVVVVVVVALQQQRQQQVLQRRSLVQLEQAEPLRIHRMQLV